MIIHWSIRLTNEMMVIEIIVPRDVQSNSLIGHLCEECCEVYIGETGQPLKMKIAEHVRAVKNGDVKNVNTVYEDVMNHKINWRGAEVLTEKWQ